MATEPESESARKEASPKPPAATFAQTLAAVLWGFFGVRKDRDLKRDAASINPLHLILMGVALAALLVLGLLTLVHFILH